MKNGKVGVVFHEGEGEMESIKRQKSDTVVV